MCGATVATFWRQIAFSQNRGSETLRPICLGIGIRRHVYPTLHMALHSVLWYMIFLVKTGTSEVNVSKPQGVQCRCILKLVDPSSPDIHAYRN